MYNTQQCCGRCSWTCPGLAGFCILEVAETWSLGRRITRLHVLIAQKAVLTKPQRQPVILETPAPEEALASHLGNLHDGSVLALARRYGSTYIARLQRWRDMLRAESAQLRWISILQLYLLFLPYMDLGTADLATGHLAGRKFASEWPLH